MSDIDGNSIVRNAVITVGTTALEVSPYQAGSRKTLYLRNMSSGAAAAAIITVTFAGEQLQNAVANYGYVLGPGEYISDSDGNGYKCYNGVIRAISDTVGSTLTFVERI